MLSEEELYCKKAFRSMSYNADDLFSKDCISFLRIFKLKDLLTHD